MERSIWHALCKQPTHPVSTEKYTSLVYDATTQLDERIQSVLSALDQRAIGLTKLANFESAVRDAQAMQQISPTSPLGYLRAATIYSEQGKQSYVVAICLIGRSLVDANDPGYATLEHMKDAAIQQKCRRIDFISQLPIDIVASRLIPMIIDDSPLDALKPCPYLHVSKQWRDCIFQYSDGLSFMTGRRAKQPDLEKCSQLIRFSRHIKELEVNQYTKGTWLCDLLRDNDFCSLRKICIWEVRPAYMDQFVSSLESVAITLTHLSIHEDPCNTVPMAKILSTCPNLVSLSIREPDLDTFMELPETTTWPNITTLSMNGLEVNLTSAQVNSICRRFPAVRNLDFYPCPDIKTALMIPKYCPLLKRAEIDIDDFLINVRFVDIDTGSDEVVVTKFWTFIEEMEDERDWDTLDLGSALRQHRTTIEGITWDISCERDFHDLDDIQYPRLKTLSLVTNAPSITHHAPILEELTLSATAIDANPAVLDKIPSTLKKLKLDLEESSEDSDPEAIEGYLCHVSEHCELQELAIRFGDSNGFPDVLAAIYCFKSLKRLNLRFCWTWEPHQMERFFDGLLYGCPFLLCLEIQCINAPSVYALNELKRLPYLKEIAFSIQDMDRYDSFWHELRTFSQLKCIRVYHENSVNMAPIQRLSEYRRDMNIITRSWFEPF
ncbi:hypothetical protein O0I10_006260 [Lichtheimia ornata]|uniref:F-box domain-containing protein n=1 Tax=Lichtheimia ornata TaxID=688661 RepID=A0AAD7V379_9FUNG|nr:uncharacterized protein O0I10_006260 [Lichtheimia ornata]KAJ8657989.1 hypothetical protein O0I10_006260 [Lichtheimia ornata]